MSTAPQLAVPAGTWQLDPIHSTAGFAIRHAVVNTFRGEFKDVDATLVAEEGREPSLVGTVAISSIAVNSEDLKAHLMAPDFFDAQRFPTITFTSRSFTRSGSDVVVTGDLTMKGQTHEVEGRGEIVDGAVDLYENTRLGLSLETAIDRTQFGVSWNAQMPKGGLALSNTVKLILDLAFVRA